MVVLTDEDMAELPLPTTRNVEVVQFCPADQLDPILFNRSYYVEPEAAGTRAYCLLRDALEESGKIAIAQVALRQRESLAILRVRDGVLVLETLLWPDEVRVPDFGFLGEDIDVRPQELRMASSLIDSMTVDFDPDEYHDSYREAVQELVAAKTEGREVFQPDTTATDTGEVSSLADALRASLAAAKGGRLGAVPDADENEDEDEAPAPRRSAARRPVPPGASPGPRRAGTAKAAGSEGAGSEGSRGSEGGSAEGEHGQGGDGEQGRREERDQDRGGEDAREVALQPGHGSRGGQAGSAAAAAGQLSPVARLFTEFVST